MRPGSDPGRGGFDPHYPDSQANEDEMNDEGEDEGTEGEEHGPGCNCEGCWWAHDCKVVCPCCGCEVHEDEDTAG